MLTWAELYTVLIPDLGACPKRLALVLMKRGAREFFTRTECWRELLTVSVVADQADYPLNASYDATIKRIVSVKYDDADVSPSIYSFDSGNVLTFDPVYETADTDALTITVALVPRSDTMEIAEHLWELWGERGWGNYCIWRALSAKSGYRDPVRAQEAKAEWDRALAQATIEKTQGHKSVITTLVPDQAMFP